MIFSSESTVLFYMVRFPHVPVKSLAETEKRIPSGILFRILILAYSDPALLHCLYEQSHQLWVELFPRFFF